MKADPSRYIENLGSAKFTDWQKLERLVFYCIKFLSVLTYKPFLADIQCQPQINQFFTFRHNLKLDILE